MESPQSILSRLSENHEQWISIAVHICRDSYLAQDLVQDMYLKLSKYARGKEINEWYVYVTIKNLFYDHVKEAGKFSQIDERILAQPDTESDQAQENLLNCLEKQLEELHWYNRQLILLKQNKSPRVIQKECGINYQHIYRTTQKTEEELRGKLSRDFNLFLKGEL